LDAGMLTAIIVFTLTIAMIVSRLVDEAAAALAGEPGHTPGHPVIRPAGWARGC